MCVPSRSSKYPTLPWIAARQVYPGQEPRQRGGAKNGETLVHLIYLGEPQAMAHCILTNSVDYWGEMLAVIASDRLGVDGFE